MHFSTFHHAVRAVVAFLILASILFLSVFLLCKLFAVQNLSSIETDAYRPTTILVDAGHGGIDGGAESVTGSLEKDLNLSVSKNYATLLRVCGFTVIETRTEDIMLDSPSLQGGSRKTRDLATRLLFSREYPEALFVSIHMNKFPLAKYHGLQVYYGENNPNSKVLAETVQNFARTYLQPENHREIKKSTSAIYLLHRMESVGILVECGFLSNPEEAAALDTPAYQKLLAVLLLSATCEYQNICGSAP